jgi:glucokinase
MEEIMKKSMEKKYVVGIDLGGTKINGAISDLKGNIIKKLTVPTGASEGEDVVNNNIVSVIEKVIFDAGINIEEIKGIGIGAPGPLDSKKGIILSSPNLPYLNFNIITMLENRFKLPVVLDNDANIGAIGEFVFGIGKGTENMVYMTVSTGVGAGVILNGKIYRGSTSNAAEIGHITVSQERVKCNCGNYGCLEVMASGTAIARQAREAIASGRATSLNDYPKVTAYEVFKEAEKGDKVANAVLEKSLTYLGIGVANAITIFDPEMVVIG